MSDTVKAVNLDGNAMVKEVATPSYIIASADPGFKYWNFTGNLDDGDELEVEWGDIDLNFLCRNSPDTSGLEISADPGGIGLTAWLERLVKELRSNFFIDRDFVVSYCDDLGMEGIRFDSRDIENVAEPFMGSVASGFGNEQDASTFGATAYNPNYSLIGDVWVEEPALSGAFIRVAELDGTPEIGGELAFFDLRNSFGKYLGVDTFFTMTEAERCDKILRKYYFRYAERYGEPATVKILSNPELATNYVMPGKLPFLEFPDNTWFEEHFEADEGRKFLTRQPRTKRSHVTMKDRLYLWANPEEEGSTLKVNILYSDATTYEMYVPLWPSGGDEGVYCIPCGFTELGCDVIYPLKTPIQYTIQIENGFDESVISEVFTWELIDADPVNNNYLMFQNSYGGMDVVWCTEKRIHSAKYKYEEFQHLLGHNYVPSDAEYACYDKEFRRGFEMSTGWKNAGVFEREKFMEWMLELAESRFIYVIGETDLIQIGVKLPEDLYADNDPVYGMKMQIENAFNN